MHEGDRRLRTLRVEPSLAALKHLHLGAVQPLPQNPGSVLTPRLGRGAAGAVRQGHSHPRDAGPGAAERGARLLANHGMLWKALLERVHDEALVLDVERRQRGVRALP